MKPPIKPCEAERKTPGTQHGLSAQGKVVLIDVGSFGQLIFVPEGRDGDVILTGDAAKNRAELLSQSVDMAYDPSVSRNSIDSIWALWMRKPESILVPGHDVPMVLDKGEPRYIGARSASMYAWFGTDLGQTTLFELTVA